MLVSPVSSGCVVVAASAVAKKDLHTDLAIFATDGQKGLLDLECCSADVACVSMVPTLAALCTHPAKLVCLECDAPERHSSHNGNG